MLDQRRMTRAYRAVEGTKEADRDEWVRVVMNLGPEIQRSGLLQAVASLHRGPSKKIAEDLCGEIHQHLVDLGHLSETTKSSGLLIEVRDLDSVSYMRVSREVLALSIWLRRAAQILGKKSPGGTNA